MVQRRLSEPLDEFFDDNWVIFLFSLMKIIIGE